MDHNDKIRAEISIEEIKKTETYAEMVKALDEDMVHEMLQDSIKNNTTPVCCYRCAEHGTCEISKIGPWGMTCSGFIMEKSGSGDISKRPILVTGKTCGSDRSAAGGYVNVDNIGVQVELTDADIMAIGKRYFELCQEKWGSNIQTNKQESSDGSL